MQLVIFDWKWTLYHPPSKQLLPGAKELIEHLHAKDVKMVLVGKDQGGNMDEIVDKLDVRKYFHDIRFIKSAKTPEIFKEYIKELVPDQVWVIGDRIRGEIDTGNKVNARTVWMKVGNFSNEGPRSKEEEPDYTFHSLHDLLGLFGGAGDSAETEADG
ncbi:MAG TPA: HAD hydrolase-like protein [Verrucomicrobiae bacterium]|nr:HAD hydrolase-like protein [Verrucomicrobiae bacterium]